MLLELLHFRQDGLAVAHLETVQGGFRLVQPGARPLRLAHGGRHGAGLAIRHDTHRKIIRKPHRCFRRRCLRGYDQRVFIWRQFQTYRLAHSTVQCFTWGKRTGIRPGQKVEKQAKFALIANADHVGGLQFEVARYTVQTGRRKQGAAGHGKKACRIGCIVASLGNLDMRLRNISAKTGIDEQQRKCSPHNGGSGYATGCQKPQTMFAKLRRRHGNTILIRARRHHIGTVINHLKPSATLGAARNRRLSKPYGRLKDHGKQMVNAGLADPPQPLPSAMCQGSAQRL